MNYDTEAWYKLYIRESTEDKLLPVLNRALRDFLLRLAKSRSDATILGKTNAPGEDLARALGTSGAEADTIAEYVRSMLGDGYLSHRRGRLWITNFVEAQQARTPGARRQKTYRDKGGKSRTTDGVETHADVTPVDDSDVTGDAQVTSQKIRSDPRRSDPIRSETTAREAPAVVAKVPCPKDLALTADQLATLLTAGIPAYAVTASATKFVGKATADPADLRTPTTWRKCLAAAVSGDWNDPNRRPKSPDEQPRAVSRGITGGPSAEWPSDADLSLREAIRGGTHGEALKRKLELGQLDAALAKRLVRDREDERREAAQRREDNAGQGVGALLAGVGRPMP